MDDNFLEIGEWLNCVKCWKSPHSEQRTKVKVVNKKYCWLYPKNEERKSKKLEPTFKECKTLYTKCDFALEACVHEQALKLEAEFRKYEELQNIEMTRQIDLTDRMWILSTRYLILTEGGVCVKLYPEIISAPTEKRILCEFNLNLKLLNLSNCRLRDKLEDIRDSIAVFDRRCAQVDMTVESPFLLGDAYQKPLSYTRDLISDLFKFFYGGFCKLQSWAQLLHIADEGAIRDYAALVQPSPDYQHFLMQDVRKCTCLRTQKRECINSPQSC